MNLQAWRDAPDTAWLKDVPFHTLQQELRDQDRAFQNLSKGHADFPIFEKQGRGDNFRFPAPKQFEVNEANSRLRLPKFGWIRYRNSRLILETIRNINISSEAGKWFASIQTEYKVEQPVPSVTTAIGIGVGIARFAAFSNGSHLAPLDSFRKHEQRSKKYPRHMSRKVKLSNDWKKAKTKVAKMHHDIANPRKNYLHKATAAIKHLRIENMRQSATGTTDAPGRNVRAQAGLNKAIVDKLVEFRRRLDYLLLQV